MEFFLDRVIRPLVGRLGQPGRRVLLLVLDGMSAAIAAELGEEVRRQWAEYDPLPDASERSPVRRGMAAALPTLTAVSRTSLFAGKLMAGGQVDEKQASPAAPVLGGASAAAFHKDELRGDTAGDPFSPELSEALTDDRYPPWPVVFLDAGSTTDWPASSATRLGGSTRSACSVSCSGLPPPTGWR